MRLTEDTFISNLFRHLFTLSTLSFMFLVFSVSQKRFETAFLHR